MAPPPWIKDMSLLKLHTEWFCTDLVLKIELLRKDVVVIPNFSWWGSTFRMHSQFVFNLWAAAAYFTGELFLLFESIELRVYSRSSFKEKRMGEIWLWTKVLGTCISLSFFFPSLVAEVTMWASLLSILKVLLFDIFLKFLVWKCWCWDLLWLSIMENFYGFYEVRMLSFSSSLLSSASSSSTFAVGLISFHSSEDF